MGKTNIPWTDYTWPIVRGCSPISPGCANCWAPRQAARSGGKERAHSGLVKSTASGVRWTGEVRFVESELETPLHWRKPRRCFPAAMGDLFHHDVTVDSLHQIFAVMAITEHITYQVVTKRAERMARILGDRTTFPGRISDVIRELIAAGRVPDRLLGRAREIATDLRCKYTMPWPLPNIWALVSVEDQERAHERIPWLLLTEAVVRGVSLEPLIEEVDLDPPVCGNNCSHRYSYAMTLGDDGATPFCGHCDEEMGFGAYLDPLNGGIDWVILGCESGPGRRPMEVDWARKVRDQCAQNHVAFYLKQMVINNRLVELPELDGRKYEEYPDGTQ